MKVFPSLKIEGGLLNPDILNKIFTGEADGQKPEAFGLPKNRRILEEISEVYTKAQILWRSFKEKLENLPKDKSLTTITRESLLIPFFRLLGYELIYNRRPYYIDGKGFEISHRAGEDEEAPPVHLVSYDQELGRAPQKGQSARSPHALLQEFLNRSEHLWGIVSNGKVLRILRDCTYISRQAYIEFDLEKLFEDNLFNDFVLLYRLVHRTRLPERVSQAHECLLERYYQVSLEQGGRVRERLRYGVEECLKILANGFLSHPKNSDLRSQIREKKLSAYDFYQQLLRLVYRFLFLLVSEERGLISSNPIYLNYYSLSRFKEYVEKRNLYNDFDDLWLSLRVLWRIFTKQKLAELLEVPPLDGALFESMEIDNYYLKNRDLLNALWYLIYYQESTGSPPLRINYSALDTEELGSVYESLLDYQPHFTTSSGELRFEFLEGTERKSTGSYYTPPGLVAELIKSALEPVIEDRLKRAHTKEEKERALLSIRVCDPACGSGHFLLASARRLGKELARIRTGEEEPSPEEVRKAIREVVSHCIYGVDKNPLAVELCKVALWLEAHESGKPLAFLDHRIRCGDSLIGVFDLSVLLKGIPDEAFEALEGDDKGVVKILKEKNKAEKSGQSSLFTQTQEGKIQENLQKLSELLKKIEELREDSPKDIEEKKRLYKEVRELSEPLRNACNLWCSAFFQRKNEASSHIISGKYITSGVIFSYLKSGAKLPQAFAEAKFLAYEHKFFHWPLEFPEVFSEGGFDVVLGNPPWERIKLQEEEFFATRDRRIAEAPNAAQRKRLINELKTSNPKLYEEYLSALRTAKATSLFLKRSGFYPYTGRGDINTYSVFAERMFNLLKKGGRAGIIVPTGIATDDTNKYFFSHLLTNGYLVSLFDFDNRAKLFPDVDSRQKFALLTFEKYTLKDRKIKLSFFCYKPEDLQNPLKILTLSKDDILRINPNTGTLPIFRTPQDAELTRYIYSRVPVLIEEKDGRIIKNPWKISFGNMFHMSNDSHLFKTKKELLDEGFTLKGNRFGKNGEIYLPLYEGKMIWLYDHRYGSFERVSSRSNTQLPLPEERDYANPTYLALPWYWVPLKEVENKFGEWHYKWFLGFRNIARSTDERTQILSLIPYCGSGNTINLLFSVIFNKMLTCLLIGNFSSIVFDWLVRQKLSGTAINFFYVKQFPVLEPERYSQEDFLFIVPRVLELVYTAWDVKPFADDVWQHLDSTLKEAVEKQWEENKKETGGNEFSPPPWIDAYPEIILDKNKGIPLTPFKWSEERRARLKAELDVYFAKLYGLTRKQLRYILDPKDLTPNELENLFDPFEEVKDPLDEEGYRERVESSTFPGESFRVLKEKEIAKYGEYRTRRLILTAWENLGGWRKL